MMQQYDDDCYITINNNKLKYISYYSALDADTKYLLYQLAYPTLYLSIADKSFLFVLHFLLLENLKMPDHHSHTRLCHIFCKIHGSGCLLDRIPYVHVTLK